MPSVQLPRRPPVAPTGTVRAASPASATATTTARTPANYQVSTKPLVGRALSAIATAFAPRVKLIQAAHTGPVASTTGAPTARLLQAPSTGSPTTAAIPAAQPRDMSLLAGPSTAAAGPLVTTEPGQAAAPSAAAAPIEGAPLTGVGEQLLDIVYEALQVIASASLATDAITAAAVGVSALAAADALMGIVANGAAAIQALGPQSALQVNNVTFQSIEQEGRWKPVRLVQQQDPSSGQVSSSGRNFVLNQQDAYAQQNASSGNTGNSTVVLAEPYGKLTGKQVRVFTINCGQTSQVIVDVTWWYDLLEIWAGYFGQASAKGFTSTFSDTASITLHALPFGNYYPAKVLLTWMGWVNPVGTEYWEFRGGIVVSADGNIGARYSADMTSDNPCYMQKWQRGQTPTGLDWDDEEGFVFTVKSSTFTIGV